ncbi:hypothetical protein [Amycolatopsis sp. NPDC051102]|uniref:hypothetical protein n=1 Tax=Amycolatopsis sp. NPDC051102 TaxID=3155163 RepID=UPI003439831B
MVRPEPPGAPSFDEPSFDEPLFDEPSPGEPKNRGRTRLVIGGGVTAFVAVTAVVVVATVTYKPAPASGSGSQFLGAGSGAGAYSSYVPTEALTGTPTTSAYPTDTASTWDTSGTSTTSDTSAAESYSPGAVPDGYQRVTGPAGVSVSIPAGWSVQRGAFATTDEADAPDGSGSLIRYSGSPTPVMSLLDAVERLERTTPTIRTGYERLRLDELSSGDVVWEFRFTTKAGVQRHALGRYWRADGHDYAVYASVDDSLWAEFQPTLDVLVQTAAPR